MGSAHTLVLDVGKTNAKLSLWDGAGGCVARRSRANACPAAGAYPALDLTGLEAWVRATVRELADVAPIGTVVPVTHGAACVLVHQGQVFAPPLDYEAPIPDAVLASYAPQRDPFCKTGSPALPLGLNLGAQLAYLETVTPPWPDGLQILLWPQYWAWRFCGVAASEVTSLGCHSDLWRPLERCPSAVSRARGWAARLPPLRAAGEVLGRVTAEWVALGVPEDARVLCGLHDSNAALLAARGHPEIAEADATIVSTGTWFIAMRSLAPGAGLDDVPLPAEARDCLWNVDAAGSPAPSARFMAGREAELIAALDQFHITDGYDPDAVLAAVPALLARGTMVLPSFVAGVGPFPDHAGGWIAEPTNPVARRAALGLYLALMTDVCLDLIGSTGPILMEGRFAEAQVFARALARLRPAQALLIGAAQDDVPFGALRLAHPALCPPDNLSKVPMLACKLADYRAAWRDAVASRAPHH